MKIVNWILSLLVVIGLSAPAVSAQNADDEVMKVRYLPPQEDIGSSSDYYSEVLRLGLEKSVDEYGSYEMIPASKAMSQRDALKAMMGGKGVNIVHTMTDRTREKVLIPVRIPLVKGLIGVRLALINEDESDNFEDISDKSDLQNIVLGQGHDWPDTEILEYNNLTVKTSEDYTSLFDMLGEGDIDAFPRAVFEIYGELEDHADQGFSIAEDFYIYYPTALYFFVKKDMKGSKIAKRVELGLRKAIEDGSFDELFNKHMGQTLKQANLDGRTGIRLQNPLLPEDTPVDENKLWFLDL